MRLSAGRLLGLALLGVGCGLPPNVSPREPSSTPRGSATAGAASDRCQQASPLWPEARRLQQEGRLRRASERLAQAEKLCPEQAPDAWAQRLEVLSALGDFEEIQRLSAHILQVERDRPSLRSLAQQRGSEATQWLVPLDPGPRSKARMRATYAEGQSSLAEGDFAAAERLFLRAWAEWHPNGQALERAATAARRAGHEPQARGLFDRALLDLQRAARGAAGLPAGLPGARVSVEATDGFDGPPVPVFSPDGASLYVAHGSRLSLLATATLRERARVDADDHAIGSIALSADGHWLATGASDGAVRIREAAALDGEVRMVGGHRGAVRSLAFTADGTALLSAGFDGTVRVFDLARGAERSLFEIGPQPLTAVATRDGFFVTSGPSTPAQVRDLTTGQVVKSPPKKGPIAAVFGAFQAAEQRRSGVVQAIELSVDGKQIIIGRSAGQIELVDPKTKAIRPLAEGDGLGGLALSPDKRVLAWGSEDRKLRVWHLAPPHEVASLARHSAPLLGFGLSGTQLLLAPEGEGLLLWSTATTLAARPAGGSMIAPAPSASTAATASPPSSPTPPSPPTALTASTAPTTPTTPATPPPTALTAAAARTPPAASTAPAATGTAAVAVAGSITRVAEGTVTAVAAAGGLVAAAMADRRLLVVEVATGARRAELEGPAEVRSLGLSESGHLLATAAGRELVLWDAPQRRAVHTIAAHEATITVVAVAADGSLVASGATDRLVKVWDGHAGVLRASLPGHTGEIRSLAFSPDGLRMASGGADGHVRLWQVGQLHGWDAEPAARSTTLAGHGGPVTALLFSPDGSELYSGSEDGTARRWSVERSAELAIFPGHGEGVRALGLSGRTLVAAGGDGSTRLWRLEDGKFVGLWRAVRGGGAYAVAADGRGEIVGPASLSSFFTCLVGPLRFSLDLCEDQQVTPGLLASLLGPPETAASP